MGIALADAAILLAFLAMWAASWVGFAVVAHRVVVRWRAQTGTSTTLGPASLVAIGAAVTAAVAVAARDAIPPGLTVVMGCIAVALLPVAFRLERRVFGDRESQA